MSEQRPPTTRYQSYWRADGPEGRLIPEVCGNFSMRELLGVCLVTVEFMFNFGSEVA